HQRHRTPAERPRERARGHAAHPDSLRRARAGRAAAPARAGRLDRDLRSQISCAAMTTPREHRLTFESIPVHLLEAGDGVPLRLLHGSGPGVSVVGNFARVLEPLAERYRVFAMDWIGFGRSGRLAAPPFFDMDLWERQVHFALDHIGSDRVG